MTTPHYLALPFLLMLAMGCSGNTNNNSGNSGNSVNNTSNTQTTCGERSAGLNPEHFVGANLVQDIQEVECTLSDGTTTTCYEIVIPGKPSDHDIGPFCPRTITDTAAVSGIWLSGGKVYDADGPFIAGLAEFYDDDTWQLYDESTGKVRVTDTKEGCEAAARPDVDEAYQNYCVECSLEDVGGAVSKTYMIPKTPVARTGASEIGGMATIGVALNGAHFDPPAPVDAILAAHTIAAFDDCGGHVNPATGYHYHAATGCSKEIAQCDDHAPLIGYALDGYAIHAMTGDDGVEPADLDACRGHEDAQRGYHYHSASAGENMFIGCFSGLTVGTEAGNMGPGNMGPGNMGAGVVMCADVPSGMLCCGDGVCGGPETAANCAADCS